MITILFTKLSENNFLIYASKCYEPQSDDAGSTEFNKDIKTIVYAKKLLKKYAIGKEIRVRLLLNHIIILNNLFGSVAVSRMMFFFCEPDLFSNLKTILLWLGYLPAIIPEANLENIDVNQKLVQELRVM